MYAVIDIFVHICDLMVGSRLVRYCHIIMSTFLIFVADIFAV